MKMTWIALVLWMVVATSSSYAEDKNCYVVVKQGENLSTILRNFGIKKIFHKNVRLMTAENYPTIHNKGDLIFPGSVISIPRFLISKNTQRCLGGNYQQGQGRYPQSQLGNPESARPNIKIVEKRIMTPMPEHQTMHPAKWRLGAGLGSTWARLDGMEKRNNTEGSFLNELSPNYLLEIGYKINDLIEIYLQGGFTIYLFEDAPVGAFINDTSFEAGSVHLGIGLDFKKYGWLNLQLGYQDELSYTIPVINNIDMMTSLAWNGQARYEIDFLYPKKWGAGLYIGGRLLGGGAEVESGFGYQIGVHGSYDFTQSRLKMQIGWHHLFKESDFLEMDQKEIIAQIVFEYFINGGVNK